VIVSTSPFFRPKDYGIPLGHDHAGQITALFHDPFYPMLHGLLQSLGQAGIRERIETVFGRSGVYPFRATVHEAPDDSGPEVVQIANLMPKGTRHGDGL